MTNLEEVEFDYEEFHRLILELRKNRQISTQLYYLQMTHEI